MSQYIIGVRFEDNPYSKEYDFKYECDVIDIGVGDTVVVDTRNGLQLAKVRTVIRLAVGESYEKATAYVVQKVDLDAHQARKKKAKAAADIKKKLDDRRKQLEDSYVYAMLAQNDPEMAQLLSDYNKLTRG